ncbi:PIN domain-containing protein [Pseudomonas gingeri]|uniref:Type II toxin-antitoxin system VapC family toxin n=1 Tax=Pseudomonas gingeri TaxID=117681 RepID=A0A7Y8CP05_9PSED|nr:type II toxin-antitoxin system VapC family toxin [Pseudomonas gingeri]NWB32024.1 type II toxin-antitoxin system VapC family toxin [Pseudomonas gingeri]NWC37400.1 type II toxin-antitoxin system VapC family toxin [Pseudomonas gingeri]NWD52754.1 type II toxin-antitoxin system VapC family toxin [Pseudomonas gingeri]NWE27381.1 type II toxin-antitoxin system VapC family toxin [Pseudomonas gingeri]NWE93307.1 type II toxin-antitoxin system VapC family toxin [Pseudomonas gingeri]
MIGLDTNVLVRYVAQDDPIQSAKASALIESLSVASPGFITLVSVVELVWLLQSCYQSEKSEIIVVLETLLRTRELKVERAEIVWQALRSYTEVKADFADCLIERSAHAAGCEYVATFDSKAAKTAGMRRLT